MIEYGDWSISAQGYCEHAPQYLESIFSQSNGYIGARAAFFQDGAKPYERCTFMAGGFDYIGQEITDMINLPDIFHFRIILPGSEPGSEDGCYTKFIQSLNLKCGLYTRESVWKDKHGRETEIRISRFISMANKHSSALLIELTALNFDGNAEILTGLDSEVLNLPIYDDQMLINKDAVKMIKILSEASLDGQCILSAESRTGLLKLDMRCRITHSEGGQTDGSSPGCPSRKLEVHLRKNHTVRIEKIVSVNDPDGVSPEAFEALLERSKDAWEQRWKDADIKIDTDDASIQTAIRYNLFQLMQNRPYDDPSVSIGARGLTHSRYKGCYFWDTDIFIQPFFLLTDPGAARNLVIFRLDTLPDARENAKKLNLEGARYPWMCAIGGKEQCQTWDIGACEVHITADVAYGVYQYLRTTRDHSLCDRAGQLFIETARYWASRFSFDADKNEYNILFVKGPDEYCGISSNNAYTVFLARHNMKLAIEYGRGKDCVPGPELDRWSEIIEKSCIGYVADKNLYLQDEDFLRLEPLDFNIKQDQTPIYKKLCFDRLQRYRALKQADLVLLMLLLPDVFTNRQKHAIWDCYEPLTLHDSSLSFGIHAWAATVLNKDEKAYAYFNKSLFLDLENIMGNTGAEGIHMASLGATWQAAVFGFGGLSVDSEGLPSLEPRLPDSWRSMTFCFYSGGKRYSAKITRDTHSIECLE